MDLPFRIIRNQQIENNNLKYVRNVWNKYLGIKHDWVFCVFVAIPKRLLSIENLFFCFFFLFLSFFNLLTL